VCATSGCRAYDVFVPSESRRGLVCSIISSHFAAAGVHGV
jgi:hypothetical protein